ncbi:MAG TPA: MerR family transcriptional regulator [Acidimicrobiales bacterium]|nr:MerR family transcriptional regulator [Acidimicrobiales bacterium]
MTTSDATMAGGVTSQSRSTVTGTVPEMARIGEVAKLTGVTTRTLRYWEELDLLRPSSYGAGGERMYSPSDIARVTRIRNLQELLGFSLAEVRAVLNTEDIDVLDRLRSELWSEGVAPARLRELLEDGVTANDQLVVRLDDTLARIQAFRDERVEAGSRLRARLTEVRDQLATAAGDAGLAG